MNGIAIAASGCVRFQWMIFGPLTIARMPTVSGIATTSGSCPCAPARTHETGSHVVSVATSISSSTVDSLKAGSFVTSAILSYGPRTISRSAATSASFHPVGSSAAGSDVAAVGSADWSPASELGGVGGPSGPTSH